MQTAAQLFDRWSDEQHLGILSRSHLRKVWMTAAEATQAELLKPADEDVAPMATSPSAVCG